MNLKYVFALLCISAAFAASAPDLPGQQFYSYTDENGVQVFTNIPPVKNTAPMNTIAVEEGSPAHPESFEQQSSFSPNAFDSIINKYASVYQLDPYLIHSIIATESGFNPNAVSSKGARGLMQLMPETAKRLGVKNSFDPEQNIQAGVRHFRSLMDMFDNDLDLSLAAYNAGENLVQQLGRIPSFKETINYVQSVTNRYREKLGNELNHFGDPAPTFRYIDAAGILHLTNIPPNN